MNLFIASGRTTNEPETRYTNDGKAVASFNFAVNRIFDKENSDFFKCVAFGKTAETIEKLVKKGTKLLIEGEMRNNNYTDKNGTKRYEMQVIVNSFEFCESKGNSTPTDAPKPSPTDFIAIPDGVDELLPF
jgi:single-strand DNA-binding protein